MDASGQAPVTEVSALIGELIDQTQELALSGPRRSFLDLPGELRNQVYKYTLDNDAHLEKFVPLFTTSRRIRAEYMPLCFENTTIKLPINKLEQFLRTFIDQGSKTMTNNHTCKLSVFINRTVGRHTGDRHTGDPVINLKGVMTTLLHRPGVQLNFGGGPIESEASIINTLVEKARQDPEAWLLQVPKFESMEMRTGSRWYPASAHCYTGYTCRSPRWSVCVTIKPETLIEWSEDQLSGWWEYEQEEEHEKQTQTISVDLETRKVIPYYGESVDYDGIVDTSVLSFMGVDSELEHWPYGSPRSDS